MAIELGTAYINILPSTRDLAPGIRKSMPGVEAEGRRMGQRASRSFATSFKAGLASMTGMGKKGILGIIAGGSLLGGMGLKTAADLELAKIGFETMLGSAEKADKMLKNIKDTAARTPFTLPGLTADTQKLLAFGFAAEDVIPMLTTLGDASAGLGRGEEGLQRMVIAIGQIQAKGKIQGEEALQLMEAGVPAQRIIRNQLGLTADEYERMQRAGELTADKVIPALLDGIKNGTKGAAGQTRAFGGLMKKQSQSVSGLAATLKDELLVGIAEKIWEPMMPFIKGALRKAIDNVGDALDRIATIGKTLNGWAREHKDLAKAMAIGIAAAATAMIALSIGMAIVSALASPITLVGLALAALATGFVYAYRKSETFAKVVDTSWAFIKKALSVYWNYWVKPIFKAFWWYLDKVLIPVIKFLYNRVAKPIFTQMGRTIRAVWLGVVEPAFSAMRDFIRDKLVPAFRTGIEKIKSIWNSLKHAASVPVEFLVNTVYMKGLRPMLNAIPGVDLAPHEFKGFAAGGPVTGGIRGKDSVAARLMPGEHVLTTAEVIAAGGHRAILRWRKMLRSGKAGELPAFAGGGFLRPDQIRKAKEFAYAQAGKPYIWGSSGPNGYDCSGFMSAITNVLLGRYPYGRIGTSANFPWAGFKPGWGEFTVGAFTGNPGHVAGTLDGLNVESSGGGVRVGSGARGAGDPMFTRIAHLGANIAKGSDFGGLISVVKAVKDFIPKIKGFLSELTKMGGWGGLVRDMVHGVGGEIRKFANGKLPGSPIPAGLFDNGGVLPPGGLAYNASKRPEAIYNNRQFRSLMESTSSTRKGRSEFTITNWEKGTGYFREIADDAVDGASRFDGQKGRMHR